MKKKGVTSITGSVIRLCNGKFFSENKSITPKEITNSDVEFNGMLIEAMLESVVTEDGNLPTESARGNEGSEKKSLTETADLSSAILALISPENNITVPIESSNEQLTASSENGVLNSSENVNTSKINSALVQKQEPVVFEATEMLTDSVEKLSFESFANEAFSETSQQVNNNTQDNIEFKSIKAGILDLEGENTKSNFESSRFVDTKSIQDIHLTESQLIDAGKTSAKSTKNDLQVEHNSQINIEFVSGKKSGGNSGDNVVNFKVNLERPQSNDSASNSNNIELKSATYQSKIAQETVEHQSKEVIQNIKTEQNEADTFSVERFDVGGSKVFADANFGSISDIKTKDSVLIKENIAAIETAIRSEAKKGIDTEFTFKLKPDGLGEVTVQLKHSGEQLEVLIKPKLFATGELLAGEAKNLQSNLNSEHSAQFNQVTVAVEYGFGEAGTNLAQRQQAEEYRNESFHMSPEIAGTSDQGEPIRRTGTKLRRTLIDYMA